MVFNLEVDAEHVYSLTDCGLVVHNSCPVILRHGTNSDAAANIHRNGVLPIGHDDGAFYVVDEFDNVGQWGDEIVEFAVPRQQLNDWYDARLIQNVEHVDGAFRVAPSIFELFSEFMNR